MTWAQILARARWELFLRRCMVALADDGSTTQSCPDGQTLTAVTVTSENGSLSVDQPDSADLPPGASFEARGGGTVVRSDAKSVTVRQAGRWRSS